jgi:hypothetical protein
VVIEARVGHKKVYSPIRLKVGRHIAFDVYVFSAPDSSDRRLVTDYQWQVPAALGIALRTGELRLTTRAGVADSILFKVAGVTKAFTIHTAPGSVKRLEIDPAHVVLHPGEQQQFRARAYDEYGNQVLGQSFIWHAVGGIGTIDRNRGLLTAGDAPGTGYVVAMAGSSKVFGDTDAGNGASGKVLVNARPERIALYPNAPNPFNPGTEIRFSLPAPERVRLTVYNLVGQEVTRLADQIFPAGLHKLTWDAAGYPSGTYIYRLEAGSFVETRKMTLAK